MIMLKRARVDHSHWQALSSFILITALACSTPGWADLGDPCEDDSTEDIVIYEGDMAILLDSSDSSRSKRGAIADEEYLWPEAKVYYDIDPVYSEDDQRLILESMKHWEDHTCLRFYLRENETDYIYFVPGNCCCSFIGMRGLGKQAVTLQTPSCMRFPTVVHEIGHAVGFYHEQSRPDRDDYVDVLEENIIKDKLHNFEKKTEEDIDSLGIGYDYNSIMHYDSDAFSINGNDTIAAHDPNIVIGEATELSQFDILGTNLLYNCTSPHPPPSIILPEEPTASVEYPTNPFSCGEVFINQMNGTFTSPGYPNYTHNQDCAWIIKIPTGLNMTLVFKPVSIEFSENCTKDYIDVNRELNLNDSFFKRICGSGYYHKYKLQGSEYLIHYHTDEENIGDDATDLTGFIANFEVTDKNECASPGYCSQGCLNTFGSFVCTCDDGYYLSADGFTCFDHNECAIDKGGCEHQCTNYGGYFVCSCDDGYFLQDDGKTCGNETGLQSTTFQLSTAVTSWTSTSLDMMTPSNFTSMPTEKTQTTKMVSELETLQLSSTISGISTMGSMTSEVSVTSMTMKPLTVIPTSKTEDYSKITSTHFAQGPSSTFIQHSTSIIMTSTEIMSSFTTTLSVDKATSLTSGTQNTTFQLSTAVTSLTPTSLDMMTPSNFTSMPTEKTQTTKMVAELETLQLSSTISGISTMGSMTSKVSVTSMLMPTSKTEDYSNITSTHLVQGPSSTSDQHLTSIMMTSTEIMSSSTTALSVDEVTSSLSDAQNTTFQLTTTITTSTSFSIITPSNTNRMLVEKTETINVVPKDKTLQLSSTMSKESAAGLETSKLDVTSIATKPSMVMQTSKIEDFYTSSHTLQGPFKTSVHHSITSTKTKSSDASNSTSPGSAAMPLVDRFTLIVVVTVAAITVVLLLIMLTSLFVIKIKNSHMKRKTECDS